MRFRRYAIERSAAAVGGLVLALCTVFVICHALGFRLPQNVLAEPGFATRYAHYSHEGFGGFLWRSWATRRSAAHCSTAPTSPPSRSGRPA